MEVKYWMISAYLNLKKSYQKAGKECGKDIEKM